MRCGGQFTFLLIAMVALAGSGASQTAADVDEQITVVSAARIITGAGEEIENGHIVIIDGEIELVSRNVDIPREATVIDATDMTVIPGLVHPRTRHDLPGYRRSGLLANLTTAEEVYLDQIDFENLLEAGYTAAAFYPTGTGMPGRASVFRTAGPDDQRLVRDAAYIRMTMTSPARDKRGFRDALKQAESAIEKVEEARKEWEEEQKKKAEQKEQQNGEGGGNGDKAADEDGEGDANGENADDEAESFEPPEIDESVQPLVDLLRGEPGTAALIEIGGASDFVHVMDVLEQFESFERHYYVYGSSRDMHHAVDDLAETESLVITAPTIRNLPNTVIRYNLVAELFNVGAKVAAIPSGGNRSSLTGMRAQLADLMRSGLSREHAIEALTVNPARVVGVDEQMGTIEPGKAGDLVFLDSDPFDGHSRVQKVMILGEIVWEANN